MPYIMISMLSGDLSSCAVLNAPERRQLALAFLDLYFRELNSFTRCYGTAPLEMYRILQSPAATSLKIMSSIGRRQPAKFTGSNAVNYLVQAQQHAVGCLLRAFACAGKHVTSVHLEGSVVIAAVQQPVGRYDNTHVVTAALLSSFR